METQRLILRQWRDSDAAPFAQLNADPRVMAHFPAMLTRAQSDELAADLQQRIAVNGWGFWALEERLSGRFIGFVGLNRPTAVLPFTPCVEIGWRLASGFWGCGYATEAATSALEFAFEVLDLDRVFAFTALDNLRSQAVMSRLGMSNTYRNFDHPGVPAGHRLREHVLFEITAARWRQSAQR